MYQTVNASEGEEKKIKQIILIIIGAHVLRPGEGARTGELSSRAGLRKTGDKRLVVPHPLGELPLRYPVGLFGTFSQSREPSYPASYHGHVPGFLCLVIVEIQSYSLASARGIDGCCLELQCYIFLIFNCV